MTSTTVKICFALLLLVAVRHVAGSGLGGRRFSFFGRNSGDDTDTNSASSIVNTITSFASSLFGGNEDEGSGISNLVTGFLNNKKDSEEADTDTDLSDSSTASNVDDYFGDSEDAEETSTSTVLSDSPTTSNVDDYYDDYDDAEEADIAEDTDESESTSSDCSGTNVIEIFKCFLRHILNG